MLVHPVRHIDHVTYAIRAKNLSRYIARWARLGICESVRLQTTKYPATHIALTGGQNPLSTWEVMTGFSISEDPTSPINEFVNRYGEGVQHVAYNVDPAEDFDALHAELVRDGWEFMTPILSYSDGSGSGAKLRQLFTAPSVPYGAFQEFVQRLPGPDGSAYGGFDDGSIDNLYELYDAHSRHMTRAVRW
jgi:4-hydroxyphenylpyruvate dioxygenase-like putative hemolysin